MIETGPYALLAADSQVTALAAGRIYPLMLPENPTLPAVTYQVVGGHNEPDFLTRGRQRMRIEINCWGERYLDAIGLRAAVSAALDGYQGPFADGTNVQMMQQLQTVDFFDHDARVYRAMVEFYVFYD